MKPFMKVNQISIFLHRNTKQCSKHIICIYNLKKKIGVALLLKIIYNRYSVYHSGERLETYLMHRILFKAVDLLGTLSEFVSEVVIFSANSLILQF